MIICDAVCSNCNIHEPPPAVMDIIDMAPQSKHKYHDKNVFGRYFTNNPVVNTSRILPAIS